MSTPLLNDANVEWRGQDNFTFYAQNRSQFVILTHFILTVNMFSYNNGKLAVFPSSGVKTVKNENVPIRDHFHSTRSRQKRKHNHSKCSEMHVGN
jgi:hypothetical protein